MVGDEDDELVTIDIEELVDGEGIGVVYITGECDELVTDGEGIGGNVYNIVVVDIVDFTGKVLVLI
jgi:hypothetical protein